MKSYHLALPPASILILAFMLDKKGGVVWGRVGGEIDGGWIGEWIKRGGEEEGVLGNLFGWVGGG